MTDDTKAPEGPETDEARKRRIEEHMAKLAKNPRFKIMPPSGKSYTIGLGTGMPMPPTQRKD
jgi:hypothetical protein